MPAPISSRDDLEYRLASLHQLVSCLESLGAKRQGLLDQQAHRYVTLSKRWGATHYFGWWMIWSIVSFLAVFVGTFVWVLETKVKTLPSFVGFSVILAPPIVALVFAGVTVIVHNLAVPRRNAKRERANQVIAAQVEQDLAPLMKPIEAELAAAARALRDAYSGWFPEAYLSSDDIGACWRIVHDHRASTMEDAINRYLTDQHEQYLRDAARAQFESQERTARRAMVGNMINLAGHWGTQAALRSR